MKNIFSVINNNNPYSLPDWVYSQDAQEALKLITPIAVLIIVLFLSKYFGKILGTFLIISVILWAIFATLTGMGIIIIH